MKKLVLLLLILSASCQASLLWKQDLGIKLYNENKFQDAIKYFESYIASNPNDEDGYFWLGKIYQKQNKDKQALIAFKKAYALASNEKNIDKIDFEDDEFDNLEDYFDMAASYYGDANYKEALNYANMMLKIDPDSAGAYFIKAKVAYVEEDKVMASKYLRIAIILNNSLLKTNLAQTLGFEKVPELSLEEYIVYAQKAYFKGDINLCIDYLNKYINLDKNNIDAYVTLINCYLKNKNIEKAKEVLQKAQSNNENSLSLLVASADIIYNSDNKDNEKYEHILLKAYGINPNNKNVLLKLGNFYLENQKYKEAKKYFETLIGVDDSLYEAYFGYAYSLIKTQEFDKAQSAIKTMSLINKDSSEIPYLLSLICSSKAEYKEALSYIQSAIKKETNPAYNLETGKLNFILGNHKEAKKHLLSLEDVEAKEYFVLSCIKLNDINSAKRVITELSNLDKNRILYKYYLYKMYKSESKVELHSLLKQKPNNIQDYIDLAIINLMENKPDNANKILNNAYKKYQDAEIKRKQQEIRFMINSLIG